MNQMYQQEVIQSKQKEVKESVCCLQLSDSDVWWKKHDEITITIPPGLLPEDKTGFDVFVPFNVFWGHFLC